MVSPSGQVAGVTARTITSPPFCLWRLGQLLRNAEVSNQPLPLSLHKPVSNNLASFAGGAPGSAWCLPLTLQLLERLKLRAVNRVFVLELPLTNMHCVSYFYETSAYFRQWQLCPLRHWIASTVEIYCATLYNCSADTVYATTVGSISRPTRMVLRTDALLLSVDLGSITTFTNHA